MKLEGSQNSMCLDGPIAESERNLEDSPRNYSPQRMETNKPIQLSQVFDNNPYNNLQFPQQIEEQKEEEQPVVVEKLVNDLENSIEKINGQETKFERRDSDNGSMDRSNMAARSMIVAPVLDEPPLRLQEVEELKEESKEVTPVEILN